MRPSADALDVLCPMHLQLNKRGQITHAAPTIRKLRPEVDMQGRRFLEVFQVKRPRSIANMQDLRDAKNVKLHLVLRGSPRTELKGVMVPLDEDDGSFIVNLSFGISIIDGVRDYALTNADFAATDLAIEMLYLVEAKTAAMESSRKLNRRLEGAKAQAEEQALTDVLTGLQNRRGMDLALARLIQNKAGFALMHIDLDYFKAVNDTLGHAAGDFVLQQVAKAMRAETRDVDTVARVGGDEFTVLLPKAVSKAVLQRIGARLIERIETPLEFEGETCRISASIGTVWIQPGQDTQADEVLSDADFALYASKRAGRAQQTFYTPSLRQNEAAPDMV